MLLHSSIFHFCSALLADMDENVTVTFLKVTTLMIPLIIVYLDFYVSGPVVGTDIYSYLHLGASASDLVVPYLSVGLF